MSYMHIWGDLNTPDALTSEDAEPVANALVEWFETTSEPLENPRLALRSVHSGETIHDGLYELAVQTDAPLTEVSQIELLAVRDILAVVKAADELADNGGVGKTSVRQSIRLLVDEAHADALLQMLNDDAPLIDMVHMVVRGTSS